MKKHKYKKYCFFDIDGTLATGIPGVDQYVPASTQKALELLRQNGHFTAIATGRSHAMAREKMESLGFDNMVCDGGYGLVIDRELVMLKPLDYQACIDLCDECIEKDFIWALQPDDAKRRLAPDDRFARITGDTYMKTEVIEGLDPRSFPQILKMYIACKTGEEQKLESLKKLPWCRYHDDYLFVEPLYKEDGILRMVEVLGGKEEDVIVFGDGPNDLSMFTGRWTGVAMGNAVPELKERASFVTKNADDDGIWWACEQLGLFGEKE